MRTEAWTPARHLPLRMKNFETVRPHRITFSKSETMKKLKTSNWKSGTVLKIKPAPKVTVATLEILPVQPQAADGTTAPATTPEGWATRINRRVGECQTAYIQAGIELVAAKEALGHGGFGDLFKSGLVEIDQRTAEMLMRVAGHEALSNPNNYSSLPQSLNSLNKLAALDVTVVEQAIAAGEITPGMTISDTQRFVRSKREPSGDGELAPTSKVVAVELVAPKPAKPAAHERQQFDKKEFKRRLMAFLETEYVQCNPGCASVMRSAVAYASSDFFRPLIPKVTIAMPDDPMRPRTVVVTT